MWATFFMRELEWWGQNKQFVTGIASALRLSFPDPLSSGPSGPPSISTSSDSSSSSESTSSQPSHQIKTKQTFKISSFLPTVLCNRMLITFWWGTGCHWLGCLRFSRQAFRYLRWTWKHPNFYRPPLVSLASTLTHSHPNLPWFSKDLPHVSEPACGLWLLPAGWSLKWSRAIDNFSS